MRADVECTDLVLPVTYPKFAGMMEPGDTLYVGRYLVSGADSASLYLEVCVAWRVCDECDLWFACDLRATCTRLLGVGRLCVLRGPAWAVARRM